MEQEKKECGKRMKERKNEGHNERTKRERKNEGEQERMKD